MWHVARRRLWPASPPRADTGAGGGRLLSSFVVSHPHAARTRHLSFSLPGLHRVRAVHVLPGACVRRVARETRDDGAAARRAARITTGRSSRPVVRGGRASIAVGRGGGRNGERTGGASATRPREKRHRRALWAYRVVQAKGTVVPLPHDQERGATAVRCGHTVSCRRTDRCHTTKREAPPPPPPPRVRSHDQARGSHRRAFFHMVP